MKLQTVDAASSPEVQMNDNFETLDAFSVYGKRQPTTTGLTWGYYGGIWSGHTIANGTLGLTNNTDNYITVARGTGVASVSTATTNWNNEDDNARVYKITTASGAISAVEDHRVGNKGVFGSSVPASSLGGGGSGLTIGDAISGGTTDSVLYENGSNHVGESVGFTFDPSAIILRVGDPEADLPSDLQDYFGGSETFKVVSTDTYGYGITSVATGTYPYAYYGIVNGDASGQAICFGAETYLAAASTNGVGLDFAGTVVDGIAASTMTGVNIGCSLGTASTLGTYWGLRINGPSGDPGVGSNYAIKIEDMTGAASNNFAIQAGQGQVQFGAAIGGAWGWDGKFIISTKSGDSDFVYTRPALGISCQNTTVGEDSYGFAIDAVAKSVARVITARGIVTANSGSAVLLDVQGYMDVGVAGSATGLRIRTPGTLSGGTVSASTGIKIENQTTYAIQGGTGLYEFGGNIYLPAGTFIEGIEMTAPIAPPANGYRFFAQDNGAGKTQLMVIFSSGAAQQIAIQP